jgi:hypothetical protein
MARREGDGVTLLRWLCGGVSWFVWVVMVRACCVLVLGGRVAGSPFSWRGWCRCGECDPHCWRACVEPSCELSSLCCASLWCVMQTAAPTVAPTAGPAAVSGRCGPFVAASPVWSCAAWLTCCCCRRHVPCDDCTRGCGCVECVRSLLPLMMTPCVTCPSVSSPLLLAPRQATPARAGAGDAAAATVSRALLASLRRVC